MEEDYRTSSDFHCYINIVEIIKPSAPPTMQCRYDLGISEFDMEMENFSIGLSQDFMVDRLISNVRVSITRIGYADNTDKRHHGISFDILERKWWIELDKGKCTLQSTTQNNSRSSLKPLKRRYITYYVAEATST